MQQVPTWRGRADAWFKLLGAIVFGYLILGQIITLLRQFSDAAIILVGALLLAYFVLPAVTWLRRRLLLWQAIAIVYLAGVLVIAAAGYSVVPALSGQFVTLVHSIPQMQRTIEHVFSDPGNPIVSKLPVFAQDWLRKIPGDVALQFQRNAISYGSSLVNALSALTFLGALAVAIPVVSIYLISEAPMMRDFLLGRMPPRVRQSAAEIIGDVDAVLGGFIRGQLIVALAVGILTTIALLVLHVPYALLIGVWAGIADIVPYVGPFAGALPAGIVAVVYQGWSSLIGVGVAFVIINQIEGHVLGPRIVSSTVRISPLGVIFALLISAQLFGFVGLIVAVPLAGLVRVAIVRVFPRLRGRQPVDKTLSDA